MKKIAQPRQSAKNSPDSSPQTIMPAQALDKTYIYSYNEIGNITIVKTYTFLLYVWILKEIFMKRIISSIIVLCLAVILSGCGDKTIYHWEFDQDYTCVKKIQIVYIPSYESPDLCDVESYIVVKNIDFSYFQDNESKILIPKNNCLKN